MNFIKINAEQICSVHSHLKSRNWSYTYQAYSKKTFWRSAISEGWYNDLKKYILEEDMLKKEPDCYIKDKTVYFNPYLEILMSDKQKYFVYFKTEEKLNEYMKSEPMCNIKWIE